MPKTISRIIFFQTITQINFNAPLFEHYDNTFYCYLTKPNLAKLRVNPTSGPYNRALLSCVGTLLKLSTKLLIAK